MAEEGSSSASSARPEGGLCTLGARPRESEKHQPDRVQPVPATQKLRSIVGVGRLSSEEESLVDVLEDGGRFHGECKSRGGRGDRPAAAGPGLATGSQGAYQRRE